MEWKLILLSSLYNTAFKMVPCTLSKYSLVLQELKIKHDNDELFHLFINKTYIVGTQKNNLAETVLSSTQNICWNWWLTK